MKVTFIYYMFEKKVVKTIDLWETNLKKMKTDQQIIFLAFSEGIHPLNSR